MVALMLSTVQELSLRYRRFTREVTGLGADVCARKGVGACVQRGAHPFLHRRLLQVCAGLRFLQRMRGGQPRGNAARARGRRACDRSTTGALR